jgi:cytochrome c biogenesis protein ResB
MSEYDAILNAIETIRTANCESHDNLKELIHEGLKGVQLTITTNADITNERIMGLTKRMDISNGNVAKLQDESLKRADAVKDFRTLEANIERHKRRWVYFLAGAVILIIAVVVVYDMIGLRGIVELIP